MHLLGRGEQCLPRGQVHHVHAQRHQQPPVSRVVVGQQPDQGDGALHRVHLRREGAGCGVRGAGFRRGLRGPRRRGDARADGRGGGVVRQFEDVLHGARRLRREREPGQVEVLGQPREVGGLLLAHEQPHLGQRHHGLGLGAVVLVVAVGRVERDPGRVLAREALLRLLGGGVDLDGQGRGDGEDLQQERQVRDHLVQPAASALHLHVGRRARVGAHPHLGLRVRGGCGATLHGREHRAGSPGVVLDRVAHPQELGHVAHVTTASGENPCGARHRDASGDAPPEGRAGAPPVESER